MKLKVFVPDWDNAERNPRCTPLLYPFLQHSSSPQQVAKKYGRWTDDIVLIGNLNECDIVILKYDLRYYYTLHKTKQLQAINKQTADAKKLLVCTVKDDYMITPPLQHFHVYAWSGYASKNKGNLFVMPTFIADPLPVYSSGKLVVHEQKTAKPFIGFCGQGSGGTAKLVIDVARGLYQRGRKLLNRWPYDREPLFSSTFNRAQLLDALAQSPLVDTFFIRYKKYRNGLTAKAQREAAAEPFFRNILDTQYTLCYRGAGNFSVRLFETLACGRIPIIVMSDNLLPLPDKIDWNRFPIIQLEEKKMIAQKIAAFHNRLSEVEFIELQQYARLVWEQYLTYNGFMQATFDTYITATQNNKTTIE